MAIQKAQITGRFTLPNHSAPLPLRVSVVAVSENGTLVADSDVISGVFTAQTGSDGSVTMELPLLPQEGVEPAGARWLATFYLDRSRARDVPAGGKPAPIMFELADNTTWGALQRTNLANVPMTPTILQQVNEAAAGVFQSTAEAEAFANQAEDIAAGLGDVTISSDNETISGLWNFTTPPTVNGEPIGSGGTGGGVTIHANLTGLAADDHPQYLNQTRGDTRYYTKAQTDAAVTTAQNADKPAEQVTGLADIATSGQYVDLLGVRDVSVSIWNGTSWPAQDAARLHVYMLGVEASPPPDENPNGKCIWFRVPAP